MRALILVLILLVVGAIALIATGYWNVNQTRPAEIPKVGVTENGVVLQGGQAPKFDVETGKVRVVPPKIEVTPSNVAAGQPATPPTLPPTKAAPAQPAPAQSAPATTDSTQR